MYNVLFPSGRVLELCSQELAMMYCQAYNGTLLPTEVLDTEPAPMYNACVVNDMEVI